jgi:hypothetical protein
MEMHNNQTREAHQVLAEMAWELLPEGCGLESHVMVMANILGDSQLYAELWRRVRERRCRV